MKKLLITGISGFLGWHFSNEKLEDWKIIGTYQNNQPDHSGIQLNQLQLTDIQRVKSFLEKEKPDAIIHLAANSNPNNCEVNPSAQVINVDVPVQIASFCAKENIPFIFTSTDLVFDGKNAPFAETDPTNPVMKYGMQKADAEQKILDIFPKSIIARLPLLYGLPLNGKGFMNAWLANLRAGKNIHCFTDEYRTAILGADAVHGIMLLLNQNQSGIFHLGGREKMSRFEFAKTMAIHFGLDEKLIIPSLQSEVQMAAKRPLNTSLNSQKAFDLGFSPKAFSENLSEFFLKKN